MELVQTYQAISGVRCSTLNSLSQVLAGFRVKGVLRVYKKPWPDAASAFVAALNLVYCAICCVHVYAN